MTKGAKKAIVQKDDKDLVKDIINISGNDHHVEVEKKLKKSKWAVTSSPYYNDPVTGIPRETDIIAYKDWDIHDVFGRDVIGKIRIRLFIECKVLPEPIVLWLKDKRMDEAKTLAKDNPIFNGKEDACLTDESKVPSVIHHYIEDRQVINQWGKLGHKDPLYDAMTGCINAMIYYEQARVEEHSPTINLPIIVIDDISKLYVRDKSTLGATSVTENQQLETFFSYKGMNSLSSIHYFLLDIVELKQLDNFLTMLSENDIRLLRNSHSWHLRH